MAKSRKLTEEEIGRLANAEIQAAITYDGTDFQKSRVRAMEYYRGEMKDLENEDGLSEAVTHDVQDVIGWILPGLMRVFFSADDLGQYSPENEEDEQGAQQATDYANHVIMKECNGYQVFWDVFHDSLLHANGVVKHWWEESEKVSVHFASGLDDDQYAELVNSPEIAIIAHREDVLPYPLPEPDEQEQPIQLPGPSSPQPPGQPGAPPMGPPMGGPPGPPQAAPPRTVPVCRRACWPCWVVAHPKQPWHRVSARCFRLNRRCRPSTRSRSGGPRSMAASRSQRFPLKSSSSTFRRTTCRMRASSATA